MSTTLAPRQLRDLPGPRGLPLLGQLLEIEPARFHQQLEDWRAAHGDLFRLRLARREFMVVAEPEACAAALRDRPGGLGRTQRIVSVAAAMGFSGVFSANGDDWRRQRPMVMAALDPRHLRSYYPSLAKVTARFAGAWRRAAEGGEAIELQTSLMRYTVDAISGLAFGVDTNTIESEGDVIQQHLDKLMPAIFRRTLAPLELWRLGLSRADREVAAAVREVAAAVEGFIAQARVRLAQDPALREKPRNLIEAMIAAADTPGSGITDRDLAGNVKTMLLAGEDTTAHTLAWMIDLLARNPEALARARAEVDRVLAGRPWPESIDEVAALDYVEACAHETMRLKPVAPIMALQTERSSVIAGVELPAGALVMFLFRAPAVDARHFPDPQRFDPGRWLEGGGADAGSAKRIAMPFGAGPRICPGRYLALVEIKTVIAMLLAGFEILGVDTPDGGPPQERLALTMAPVGLRLRLACRRSSAGPGP
ncbi:MAG: cytochrome P450 [Burkholderiales bacterium]|nr:cytochrome P450 [Burkholderiales bacterium]MDE2394145.1 cytochrome P450 [Burkholderiales bacterium]MDE2456244.1 cytochrome P450 [Burkholderiales bacterium]